jgi:spore coat polysaccharide biosynthesis protein SpsF
MNIIVVIQARKGSTRFPGKILMPVLGKTLLERQIERIFSAKLPTKIVVATTTLPEDDKIVEICSNKDFLYFRGHPTDLLDRHYKTALAFKADIVVKIPSDCPLIDPEIIDKVIRYYLENTDKYDFVSNLHPPTYPDGNDVEVIPMNILHAAWKEAEKNYELEHTTPYIWDNQTRFRIGNVFWETGLDYSMTHRFTIDYFEDYRFIKSVFEELYPLKPLFRLEDILELLSLKPEILTLNKIYTGVNWYRHHLNNLKTIDLNMTKVI